MFTRSVVIGCKTLLLLTSALGVAARADSDSLADAVPAGAIAFVEFSNLSPVIDQFRESDFLRLILTSEPYENVAGSTEYRKVQAARQIFETHLGMDLWAFGKGLLGGQVAVAIYPNQSGRPDVVAIVRPTDGDVLVRLKERLAPLLVLAEGDLQTSSSDDGVQVTRIGKLATFAFHGEVVVLANDDDLFSRTQALLADRGEGALADDETFQAKSRQMGTDHEGRLFIDTGMIADATDGRLNIGRKLDNPLGSLLVGGVLEMIANSPYAGVTLDVDQQQFELALGVAGSPESLGETYAPFFADHPDSGTRALPQPDDLIGGFTLYRDFGEWYARREELLQPQVLPGFDQFESGLGNLLPGRDFSEDVLPLIGKNFTLLAARQDYEHLDGEPGVKLPGFAAIVDLAEPDEGAEVFRLFFQTFSSILNIQAGQQGRQPWVLESETYHDVEITYGKYLQKPSGSRLPLVFNFRPASARVADRFVVTSSLGLCRQLIDEMQKSDDVERVKQNLSFEFQFGPFADVLEANGEFFQAQRIEQGRSLQEAERDVALVLELLRSFESLDFNTVSTPDGFLGRLTGSWK